MTDILAGLLCVALIGLLRTKGSLILMEWTPALLWALPGIACLWVWARRETADADPHRDLLPGWILLAGLVLYTFSSASLSTRAYLQPSIPGGILSSLSLHYVPARVALSFSVFCGLLIWKRITPAMLFTVLLVASAAMCAQAFMDATGGQPIFRDDHPAFMHRFWGIREAFPAWAYYDPTWNGGRMQTAAVASGAINLGFLFQPLWQLGPIHEMYNTVLMVSFLGCVPLVAIASARLCGCGWTGSVAGGLLALTLSRYFFLWLLNYGTVSACSTSPVLLLLAACLYRVLYLGKRDRWLIPLFAFAMFFYLAWPPAAIMGIPLAIAAGLSLMGQPRRTVLFVLLLGGVGMAAALPHYLAMAANIDLSKMAGIHSAAPDVMAELAKGWRILLSHLVQANPLIVFLGIAGIAVLKLPGRGRFLAVTLLLLMIPAGWGEAWKPQYQLVRTGIPLMFLAILPAAFWIDRLTLPPRYGRAAAALIGGFLLAGSLSARSFYANETPIRFNAMDASVEAFVDFIKNQTDPGDRILFAGPMVHGVGGGHVAYLPVMTDREMLACDYYAFSPKLVEFEYPPKAWRNREGGVEEFLELYNVSHVVTYHKRWISYFEDRPDIYTHAFTFGDQRAKEVYRVNRASSLFLEGGGRIDAGVNEIVLYPDDPQSELVLKYNWVKELQVEPPAEMAAYPVGEDLDFIRVTPNGLQKVRIFHKGVW